MRNWNYTIYSPEHVDVIWASPPCTVYSRALTPRAQHIYFQQVKLLKKHDNPLNT